MTDFRATRVLLINPPLWNPYAPHLAVPLLLGVLRRHGVPAAAIDLSAETMRYLLSRAGASAYGNDRPDRLTSQSRRIFEAAQLGVDRAVAFLRSPESIGDLGGYQAATAVCRTVLAGVAALTPGSSLEFDRFETAFRPTRSRDVVRAAADHEHNPYVHVFEQILTPRLRRLPDLRLVGLSVSADSQLIAAMTAARLIKRERPDVHVTLGGNFITRIAPRLHAHHPFFDTVDSIVRYEGEESILVLADRVDQGEPVTGVPGIMAPANGRLHSSPPASVDMTDLAVPDFTDYPLADGYLAPGPVLPIIASRSCAWNCAFCAIPFASNKFRIRDPESVVAEMDEQHRRHGIGDFQFVDEILTVKSLRQLSRLLPGRDYRWYGETRFSPTIDRRLTDALHAAGCRRLDLGLESYNQDVLDRMRKEIKVSWIAPNLDALLGSGISVHLFGIAGFPGEARWQTARTVEFATKTIARSRDRYRVPDSTFGIGPFVLDALSPVAASPQEFEVRVLHPDPSEDLQMGLRYTYHGAEPEPADDAERDVARRADAILQGAFEGRDQPPEEVMFLRAGGSDRADRAGRPTGGDRVRCVPADWRDRRLRLAAPWVTRLRTGAETVLYEPAGGALLTVPSRLVDRLPATATELADGPEDVEILLAGLHHGCLEPAGDAAGFQLSGPADLGPELLLGLAPGVRLERASGATATALISRTTARRLQLSAAGVAVVDVISRHGEFPYRDLSRLFRPEALPRAAAFVWRLLTLGLLSARSPDSQHPAISKKEVTTCRA